MSKEKKKLEGFYSTVEIPCCFNFVFVFVLLSCSWRYNFIERYTIVSVVVFFLIN